MALSGTINGSVTLNSSAYNFYINWSGVQSIAGNYTDITMKVYWSRNSGFFNEFDTVGDRSASVTIGDSTFNWSQRFRLIPFSPNPYLIKEFTSRVNHNADGTKSVTISARANGYAATYGTSSNALSSGDCTASATVTLDTIPRASTAVLSTSAITAGNSITVNITPAAASTFNHDIKWTLGANQISVNLPVGTNSHTVTIPTSWCNSFPNANSSSVSCTVQTKQGSNIIGGLITKVFTLNVPAYTPSLSVSLAGQSLLSGEYVATKSKVVGTVTASSMYGASVSVSAVLDGKTYQVTSGTWTSSVLTEGTFSIVTTLTDSRGKTATNTKSITVRAYSPPYITTVSAVRCLSNGTVNENGTYAKVTFIGGCSSVNNKNSRIYKVNAVNITNNSYSINKNDIIVSGITTESTHVITASIQDSYTTVTKSVTVPTVAVTMDYHASGKGVSFGKVAETQNVLDSAWKIRSSDIPSYAAGNFLSRGTDGTISDSGSKASDFDAAGAGASAVNTHDTSLSAHEHKIPLYFSYYKSSAGSAWWKCFSIPWKDNTRLKATFLSGAAYYDKRGHAELFVSATGNNRADLVYSTNGINKDSFDVRTSGSMGSGTITVYFMLPQWSYYTVIVERRPTDTVTTYNVAETPTGDVMLISEVADRFVENRVLVATTRGTGSSKFTCIAKLTAEVNQRACVTVNLMQGSARATAGILAINCHHSDSSGMEVTAHWVYKPSTTIEAYYTITDAIDVRIYLEYVNTYSRVYFAPISPAHGDVVFYEEWGIVASVAGATKIEVMPVPTDSIEGTLPITKGGTGQTTAALARNALGLGNTTGALPIANGGTGQTTIATARTALGIRTYSGSATLAANSYYVDITCSGVTTSSMIFINNNEAVINTTEPLLVSCRAIAANTVRAYTIRTKASSATVYYHILAIG